VITELLTHSLGGHEWDNLKEAYFKLDHEAFFFPSHPTKGKMKHACYKRGY